MTTALRRAVMTLVATAALAPTLRADGPADAFAEADLAFRGLYAMGRAETLAKLGPVIVVEMDKLILIRGRQALRGDRDPARLPPPQVRLPHPAGPLRRPGPLRRRPGRRRSPRQPPRVPRPDRRGPDGRWTAPA